MVRGFEGTFTALVTPFRSDGSLDEDALVRLVDFQLEGGVDGLALAGATGEESTLSADERRRMVDVVRERAGSRLQLLVGASDNATHRAVELARSLASTDVDGLLSVVPFYNRPNQEGIVEHFKRIADAAARPVVVSNVPGRTGCRLEAETALRLAEHENIVSLDEGSADLELAMAILREAPEGFTVLSGEDALTLPLLVLGASGTLSLVGNELPEETAQIVREGLAGNVDEARETHYEILALARLNDIDSNPMPVKAALAKMGLIEEHLRAPLTRLGAAERALLERELVKLGLASS